ncbi:MAG: hypothetical protein NTY34_02655 [Candidatus Omnitrophica bacterium]|nr:hypothetical protein [Candidatus Omnitrophota bacterium]
MRNPIIRTKIVIVPPAAGGGEASPAGTDEPATGAVEAAPASGNGEVAPAGAEEHIGVAVKTSEPGSTPGVDDEYLKDPAAASLYITRGLKSDAEKAVALRDWVADNINYAIGHGAYWDASEVETLKTRRGMCYNAARLFIAMARAAGLRARYGVVMVKKDAYGLMPALVLFRMEETSEHIFASVFIDGNWVDFDIERDKAHDVADTLQYLDDIEELARKKAAKYSRDDRDRFDDERVAYWALKGIAGPVPVGGVLFKHIANLLQQAPDLVDLSKYPGLTEEKLEQERKKVSSLIEKMEGMYAPLSKRLRDSRGSMPVDEIGPIIREIFRIIIQLSPSLSHLEDRLKKLNIEIAARKKEENGGEARPPAGTASHDAAEPSGNDGLFDSFGAATHDDPAFSQGNGPHETVTAEDPAPGTGEARQKSTPGVDKGAVVPVKTDAQYQFLKNKKYRALLIRAIILILKQAEEKGIRTVFVCGFSAKPAALLFKLCWQRIYPDKPVPSFIYLEEAGQAYNEKTVISTIKSVPDLKNVLSNPILILDDMLASGFTLHKTKQILKKKFKARNVYTAALFDLTADCFDIFAEPDAVGADFDSTEIPDELSGSCSNWHLVRKWIKAGMSGEPYNNFDKVEKKFKPTKEQMRKIFEEYLPGDMTLLAAETEKIYLKENPRENRARQSRRDAPESGSRPDSAPAAARDVAAPEGPSPESESPRITKPGEILSDDRTEPDRNRHYLKQPLPDSPKREVSQDDTARKILSEGPNYTAVNENDYEIADNPEHYLQCPIIFCRAIAAFNVKTGERILIYLYPDELDENRLMKRLFKGISGPNWRLAVITKENSKAKAGDGYYSYETIRNFLINENRINPENITWLEGAPELQKSDIVKMKIVLEPAGVVTRSLVPAETRDSTHDTNYEPFDLSKPFIKSAHAVVDTDGSTERVVDTAPVVPEPLAPSELGFRASPAAAPESTNKQGGLSGMFGAAGNGEDTDENNKNRNTDKNEREAGHDQSLSLDNDGFIGDGVSGDNNGQKRSTQRQPKKSQELLLRQTSQSSLPDLSANSNPIMNNPTVDTTNTDLSHNESILPKTPPSNPTSMNPWNNVSADLLTASNRLSDQNGLDIPAVSISQPDDTVKPAAPLTPRNDGLTAQNEPDIENLRKILFRIALEEKENERRLKKGEEVELKYYTVTYNESKIGRDSDAGRIIKYYVETILPMYVRSGKDRVKLIANGKKGGVILSVECYSDQGRARKIGEGRISIEDYKENEAMKLVAMLNMAFLSSQIPNNTPLEEMAKYEDIISIIRRQCVEISGDDQPIKKALKDISKGIFIRLPHAGRIPIEKAADYYRLILAQLEQAA